MAPFVVQGPIYFNDIFQCPLPLVSIKEKVEINRNNAMDEVVKVLAKLPLYS